WHWARTRQQRGLFAPLIENRAMTSTATPPHPPQSYRTFGAHPLRTDGDLLALGFGPDGALWSVEEPGLLRQWDVRAQRQLDWRPLQDLATLWAFVSTGLVASASDELVVWDARTGERRAEWSMPSWVDAVAFTRDGQTIATGDDE